ncbi:MAG: polysaccharide deacetylase family protein [Leadbetterella sp.]|nr:polysaccharide deacetylase family protein [Leadbetterella sp.]
MRKARFILLLLCGLQTVFAQQKYMAVTVDDLPFVGTYHPEKIKKATGLLLQTFRQYDVTAVGFVNEVYSKDTNNTALKTGLLEDWLKAGHELGNHTWSHPAFNNITLEEYQEDVLRGDKISRALSRKYDRPYRYFRHPYLQTGNDSLKKYGLEKFLQENDYTPVPVTMEANDWYFSHAYINAGRAGDTVLQNYIGREYIRYTLASVKYYEDLALEVAGKPVRQVFLIHANELNARYFSEILSGLRSQGYRFLTVEEAMKDPVYAMPERVVVPGGFSWLHRWRITAGKKTALKEPEIPEAVKKAYEK